MRPPAPGFLITSMNINIIMHKQELSLIIATVKMGKGEFEVETEMGREGN